MQDFNIILIDDEESFLLEVEEYFGDLNMKVESDPQNALKELATRHYDLVITDYKMPAMTGVELLIEAKKQGTYDYGVLLTAHADMEILKNAINKDLIMKYLSKPIRLKELRTCIEELLEECRKNKLENEKRNQYKQKYSQLLQEVNQGKDWIIGLDKGLLEVRHKVESGAKYSIPVMLTGETGTGKEVIARFIHKMSQRKDEIFVSINCAAFPENLIESELFGYEKGAFTGADKMKIGKIEMSHGGTLFLDEIGDLKLELQTKLLRILQEKKIERLGSNVSRKIDFRLITATNKNLKKAIKEKKFREDLYYRINGFPIELPPLRQRQEDIEDLTIYFIKKFAKEMDIPEPEIDPEIFSLMKNYAWRGNVRQLEWTIKRILILTTDTRRITKEEFCYLMDSKKGNQYRLKQAIHALKMLILKKEINLKDIRSLLIQDILVHFNQDVKEAVKNTGISLSSFYRNKE